MEEATQLQMIDSIYANSKALLHSTPGTKDYASHLRKLKALINTLADAEGGAR